MKSLTSIFCLFLLAMAGCKQTSEIPTQYEPAFADDNFGTSNLQKEASNLGNSLTDKVQQAGSTLRDTTANVKQTAVDVRNDISDVAKQFEPME